MNDQFQPRGSTLENPILTEDVGGDEVLQAIVATADDSMEFSVGMTLGVRGCLVSGHLVGQKRWFQDFEVDNPDLRRSFGTPFRIKYVDNAPKGESDPFDSRFVHLKDARYLTGAGFAPNPRGPGFFWRGRLEDISAWSFGVVSGTVV